MLRTHGGVSAHQISGNWAHRNGANHTMDNSFAHLGIISSWDASALEDDERRIMAKKNMCQDSIHTTSMPWYTMIVV